MFSLGDSDLELLLLRKNGGLGTTRRVFNKTNRNNQTNRAETTEKFGSLVLQRRTCCRYCPICLSDCSFSGFSETYLRKAESS